MSENECASRGSLQATLQAICSSSRSGSSLEDVMKHVDRALRLIPEPVEAWDCAILLEPLFSRKDFASGENEADLILFKAREILCSLVKYGTKEFFIFSMDLIRSQILFLPEKNEVVRAYSYACVEAITSIRPKIRSSFFEYYFKLLKPLMDTDSWQLAIDVYTYAITKFAKCCKSEEENYDTLLSILKKELYRLLIFVHEHLNSSGKDLSNARLGPQDIKNTEKEIEKIIPILNINYSGRANRTLTRKTDLGMALALSYECATLSENPTSSEKPSKIAYAESYIPHLLKWDPENRFIISKGLSLLEIRLKSAPKYGFRYEFYKELFSFIIITPARDLAGKCLHLFTEHFRTMNEESQAACINKMVESPDSHPQIVYLGLNLLGATINYNIECSSLFAKRNIRKNFLDKILDVNGLILAPAISNDIVYLETLDAISKLINIFYTVLLAGGKKSSCWSLKELDAIENSVLVPISSKANQIINAAKSSKNLEPKLMHLEILIFNIQCILETIDKLKHA